MKSLTIGDQMKRLLGTIAAIALALTALVGVQPASAATSCEFAKQRAVASALSLGDISLASKASRMCDAPCDSIYAYYLLPNLSSYVESLVLDAYKTCVAANSGGGGNGGGGGVVTPPKPCTPKAFTKVGKPIITGTTKTGYRLSLKNLGTWSPEPSSLTFKIYRDGKEIDGFPVLTSKDLGKKFSVKAIASLKCYKTTSSWSATTKAVSAGNLPKLKASEVQVFVDWYYDDIDSEYGTTQLNLRSKSNGDMWFESEPAWSMVGDRGTWARANKGSWSVLLPTFPFNEYADEDDFMMCISGKGYKISVTMTVGIVGKYAPAKITIPAKTYRCDSLSGRYTPKF